MEPPAHAVPPPFGTPWWATGPWVLQRPLIPLGEGVFEHVARVRETEFGEFYSAVEVAMYLERLAKASLEQLVSENNRSERDREVVKTALAIQMLSIEGGGRYEAFDLDRKCVLSKLKQKLLDLVLIANFPGEEQVEEYGVIRPDGSVVGEPGLGRRLYIPVERREALMREMAQIRRDPLIDLAHRPPAARGLLDLPLD